jgi:DNA-directed RNA polymerase subunit RPC12/RpoP
MADYRYSVASKYDVGALDAAIRVETAFAAAGFEGVTLNCDTGLSGALVVQFTGALDETQEGLLRRLVARIGAQYSAYRQWCAVCEQWFEEISDGQPVYCERCGSPYLVDYPYGQYVWTEAGDRLKRWAEVEFFVPYGRRLAVVPIGGVELTDITMENCSPPVVLEVRRDGVRCAIQVGTNNAMWEDTVVRFSWKVVP